MKHLITAALAALVLAAGCSPLKIAMDSKDKDGARMVYTTDQHLFGNIDIALGAKINGKDTVLAVIVTCDQHSNHGLFDRGNKFLMRLSDQSVITLENVYDKEFEKETSTTQTRERVDSFGYAYAYDPFSDGIYITPYEVSSFIPRTQVNTVTNSYALYLISKAQLDEVISKGVIKLRVEKETGEFDMRDPSSASATFSELKKCLFERIYNPVARKEF